MDLNKLFKIVEGFDWDEGNKSNNLEKHEVRNRKTEEVFFNKPVNFDNINT